MTSQYNCLHNNNKERQLNSGEQGNELTQLQTKVTTEGRGATKTTSIISTTIIIITTTATPPPRIVTTTTTTTTTTRVANDKVKDKTNQRVINKIDFFLQRLTIKK